MTDNRSKPENTIDSFFGRIAEEAEDLPVRIINIPDENHKKAGICLLAEDRSPSGIDDVAAALYSGAEQRLCKTAFTNNDSTLPSSLSIEIERARFTSTALSLLLIKIENSPDRVDINDPSTFITDDLQRVDIITTINDTTLAILMPETGGQAAVKRAELFLASLADMITGCGLYSCHGDNCPGPEEFLRLAKEELDKSCNEKGKVFHNEYEEPLSCQVSVEEKNELFHLFGKDKS